MVEHLLAVGAVERSTGGDFHLFQQGGVIGDFDDSENSVLYNGEFLPEGLTGTKFYEPGKNAREEELRRRLKTLWEKYGY